MPLVWLAGARRDTVCCLAERDPAAAVPGLPQLASAHAMLPCGSNMDIGNRPWLVAYQILQVQRLSSVQEKCDSCFPQVQICAHRLPLGDWPSHSDSVDVCFHSRCHRASELLETQPWWPEAPNTRVCAYSFRKLLLGLCPSCLAAQPPWRPQKSLWVP